MLSLHIDLLSKEQKNNVMNSDLQIALDNLKKDGVVLKLTETKFGANDLGFWLVEQTLRDSKQN